MKRFLMVVVLLVCIPGCKMPEEAKDLVKDKHAQLYVLSQRIDSTDNKPTREQLEATVKALAKDMESLDKLINNWKPSTAMQEVNAPASKIDGLAISK